jgi:hypothetical protein
MGKARQGQPPPPPPWTRARDYASRDLSGLALVAERAGKARAELGFSAKYAERAKGALLSQDSPIECCN